MTAFPYGRYKATPSPELHAWIEKTFVQPAPEARRAEVRAAVLEELEGAELELLPGDYVVSRSGEQEWVRVELPPGTTRAASFTFEKAPGIVVRVERRTDELLVAYQPGKPPIEFRA